MTFSVKRLDFSFTMAQGSGGPSNYTHTGLRARVRVTASGGEGMGVLEAEIWGLPLETMNALSTVGTQIGYVSKNSVTVMAGDDVSGMKTAFIGTIINAYVDGRSQPNVGLHVQAVPGGVASVQPRAPQGQSGTVDAAQMISQVVSDMGMQFENNGVSVQLNRPYLFGSQRDHLIQLCRAAGISWVIQDDIVAIWPPGQSRQSAGAVLFSPANGMVGYPAFDQANIIVVKEWEPIKLGQQIQVQSQLTPACGTWNVLKVDYALDAEIRDGEWFVICTASTAGSTQPAVKGWGS